MKKKRKRSKIRLQHRSGKGLKNQIWFKTYGTVSKVPCFWCKTPLSFHESTVDHEPPLAEGGKWEQAVIACESCNKRRSTEQSIRKREREKDASERNKISSM